MAIAARYAGVGEQCPAFQVAVVGGGSIATAKTLYLSFQLQNRIGYNLSAISTEISVNPGQKMQVTVPSSVRQPGWDILYYIISGGSTDDPSTHVQLARIPNYQYGVGIEPQSLPVSLPVTIDFNLDSHLEFAPSVSNLASLPTGAPRLDGQVRWVNSESKFFEYRADSDLELSSDVISADIGQWVRVTSPSTYVDSTTTGMGSDRPLVEVNPATVIPTPPYPASTGKILPNWTAKYWLYNDNSYVLPAGTEFGIELEYNNRKSPDLLSGLFLVRFDGFVLPNGVMRTQDGSGNDFPNLGAFFPWQPKKETPFITVDDLQPGEAIALSVKPFFSVAELNNEVSPGAVIGVIPTIRTQSGDYNPIGKITGNAVFALGDKYRIVPNSGLSVKILSGSAIVGGYDFPVKPARNILGVEPNQAGQKVIINGNGAVFIDEASYSPLDSEALRATIGTVAGVSSPSAWTSYVAIASGQNAAITISYPSSIRSNYPDVIAGSNKGVFNAPLVNIFLQRQDTGEIREFGAYSVVAGASQEFSISAWADGTIVSSLPTAPGADFSLFSPGATVLIADTTGNFPATNYRACYNFEYNGLQVTSISHASPPCIQEYEGSFAPPSISIGNVTSLPYGDSPTVVDTSPLSNVAVLDFGIPAGEPGQPSIILPGEIEAIAPFDTPSFDLVPTANPNEFLVNLRIPRGVKGDRGERGEDGSIGISPTIVPGEIQAIAPFDTPSVELVPTLNPNEYALNLKLPRGVQGERGLQGIQGEQGEPGADGATGATGATGAQGIAGNVTSATGALILDDSFGATVTLSSGQVAIRNIQKDIYTQEGSNIAPMSTAVKANLISVLN